LSKSCIKAKVTDDTPGMIALGAEARGGGAPRINTPYSLDGSDGRHQHGENAVNVHGAPGNEATSVDPAEAFANELDRTPTGQTPNAAINVLNAHVAKARDAAVVDKIQAVWSRYVKNYGRGK
jgi:hypothetical protein